MNISKKDTFNLGGLGDALPGISSDPFLVTSRVGQSCPVCKVGEVVPDSLFNDKILTIYGRLGQRQMNSKYYR